MRKVLRELRLWLAKSLGNLFDFVKKNASVAVKVTEALNKAVNSPTADLITDIIPGHLDNTVKIILRQVLPQILQRLLVANGIMQESESITDAIPKTVEYLRSLPKLARASWWIIIAGKLTVELCGGHIPLSSGVAASQQAFEEEIA